MKSLTQLFSYEGNEVAFRKENGETYVNATEMAKAFKKSPSEWIRLPSTTKFLHALSAMGKSHRSRMIHSVNGVGTWMHEDVALEFSRWLSPAFAIWCNDRIKELLTIGMTTTLSVEEIANNPDLLIEMATKLKESREKAALAEKEAEIANQAYKETAKELNKVAPKAEYYDKVLQSTSAINTNQIALELGVTAIWLNDFLKTKRIIYRQGNQWLLYAKYRGLGLHKMETFKYINSKGEVETRTLLKWTEKGRKAIHDLFNKTFKA